MALASQQASPDNAVPSLPGLDSWLSKKKQKNPKLVPARLGAVKLHFRCCPTCRNILDVGLVTRLDFVCFTYEIYSRSIGVRDKPATSTCDDAVIRATYGYG